MRSPAGLLGQPMLHFLLGGAAIFAVYSALGGGAAERAPGPMPSPGEDRRIVVGRGQIESLASGFAARWRRPPSEAELAALIAEQVREEALVREALALGLDRGDAVIRRHLRIKMEFLAQDVGSLREPTDDDLRGLLQAEAERFRLPAVLSFRQVFIDHGQRSDAGARREAERLLAALNGPDGEAISEEAGDRFLLGYAFRDTTVAEVERNFGGGFGAAVEAADPGRWVGPLESSYGLHLIRLDARVEAQLPPLDVVRAPLRGEWAARQRRAALDTFMGALLARYTVRIADPVAEASPAGQRP